ncbi:tetratricopeptide repeat protein [Actinomadura barringtoniae]|uniref:Tetratricopeptide repeat protein n=1 Tax=Actinomadura barringtoniae TaxID=1427535 RepID=A0A939PME3_9ACTN|nr:tetratricopeptide repeat protein [Actinomadura barringtoniae]MBO2455027.1 tetratricopeptide repeat protein [Actinomadura barringtoniae]
MAGETQNELSGIVIGPAVMGRDITVTLPAQVPLALSGLPAASPAFTGRHEDLAKVLDVLEPHGGESAVVVTAVGGMGGVGKTELAVQAARAALARDWFPGGVLFADLFGYDCDRKRDPTQVLGGMLRSLGVPDEHIPPGGHERVAMYRSILGEFARQERRVLVVADNVNSEQQVSMLLPTDGESAAIVTSRHTLAMLNARLLDLNVLSRAEAEEMLRRVVEVGRPGDTRVTDVGELVEMCGRLPLAVRIVGALLADEPSLQPAQLARELAEVNPLGGLAYGGEAVAKAFARSYRTLTGEQQRTFRMLSINPGPDVSTEAAAVLTGLAEPAVRQILRDLARAHLIETGETYGRWRIHDLLRQYAEGLEEEFAHTDGRDEALSRLLKHYLRRTQATHAHLDPKAIDPASSGFADRDEALGWLDSELPNLIAAVHAALTHQPFVAARLPNHLAEFMDGRRLFNDWLALARVSIQGAHRIGDRNVEGHALGNLACALAGMHRFDEAVSAHEAAAAVFRELDAPGDEAGALCHLAFTLIHAGRYEEAVVAGESALAVFQEIDDRHGEGRALSSMGAALARLRRHGEAIDAYTGAEAVFREVGNLRGASSASTSLGEVLTDVQRFEEAVHAHERTLDICRELHDRSGEGGALTNLGITLYKSGRAQQAVTVLERSMEIFRELGNRYSEGTAGANLARALLIAGRYEEAAAVSGSAVTIFRELGSSRSAGWALFHLGDTLTVTGPREKAEGAFRDAIALFTKFGDATGKAAAERRLARVEG